MLGLLFWNIYINDLLNLIPSTRVYADDITVSMAFTPREEESMMFRLLDHTLLHRKLGQRW